MPRSHGSAGRFRSRIPAPSRTRSRPPRSDPSDLACVAAHGQTLYHAPPDTIQWLDPALVAAEVGCAVVSDFRRADCAAGGQGAPLVPFADYVLFRHPTKNRVLLNIGGIANLTSSRRLRDWTGSSRSTRARAIASAITCAAVRPAGSRAGVGYDLGGAVAAKGIAIPALVKAVLADPYFAQTPPKSTDGPAMIDDRFGGLQGRRATLPVRGPDAFGVPGDGRRDRTGRSGLSAARPDEVIVSGGGAKNTLMEAVRRGRPGRSPDDRRPGSIRGRQRKPLAFALLAAATLDGVPSNVPSATGARRAVVLGSITPKPSLTEPLNERPLPPADRTAPPRVDGPRRDEHEEAVALMNAQDAAAVAAVGAERANIARAVELVVAALSAGGRLIYVGAGTSGRLGVLDAAECPPTFRTDPEQVQGIIAGGERRHVPRQGRGRGPPGRRRAAMDAEVGRHERRRHRHRGGRDDAVRPRALAPRPRARREDRLPLLRAAGPDEPPVDVVIRPLTGPEVVTGSTRLKAGTATKLVLNTISTVAMVRLGKVYENLMVDLRATNAKLWDRGAGSSRR